MKPDGHSPFPGPFDCDLGTPQLEELRTWTKGNAADELRARVGQPTTGEQIAGTLRLGTVSREVLTDPNSMLLAALSLAAAYVDQTDDLRIPYFDLA